MSFLDNLGLSRRQLTIAAVGLGASLAVLLLIYLVWLRAPYQVLFADLRTADAATVVAELDKKKVPYRLRNGGKTILVPAKLVDATRLSVSSEDLPLKGTVGFELFNKSDMGLTEFAQQINYRRALQGELARTIMGLDGVESARVHLSFAETTVFRDDRKPAKASVTIIARDGADLGIKTVQGVQSLVAAAVPDLDVDHVVVLDEHGVVISRPPEPTPAGGPLTIEAQYADEISFAIRRVFDGAARVVVSAPGALEPAAMGGVDPEAAATATIEPAHTDLAPVPRSFPLHVRVLLERPVSPAVRSRIQQMAIAAAGLDPALGDSLEITALSPSTAEGAPSSAPTHAGATRPPSSRVHLDPVFAAPVVLALLGLLLIAAWRARARGAAPRTLGPAQKEAYRLRLARLLSEEEDAHVAPRI